MDENIHTYFSELGKKGGKAKTDKKKNASLKNLEKANLKLREIRKKNNIEKTQ